MKVSLFSYVLRSYKCVIKIFRGNLHSVLHAKTLKRQTKNIVILQFTTAKKKVTRETFSKLNNAHAIRRKWKIVSTRVSNICTLWWFVRFVMVLSTLNAERSQSQRPSPLSGVLFNSRTSDSKLICMHFVKLHQAV